MRDISHEELVSFSTARGLVPGKRPHLSALYRWAYKGVRGVKLDYVMIGGAKFTSREALQRFFECVTSAADQLSRPLVSLFPKNNPAAVKAAQELARRGY